MEFILETERLFLRKIKNQDVDDLFEMDSEPHVYKFIENNFVTSKEQIVEVIHVENKNSMKILEKQGFELIEVFDPTGDLTNRFEILQMKLKNCLVVRSRYKA